MNEEEKLRNIAYKFGELTNAFLDLANSAEQTKNMILYLESENNKIKTKMNRIIDILKEE